MISVVYAWERRAIINTQTAVLPRTLITDSAVAVAVAVSY